MESKPDKKWELEGNFNDLRMELGGGRHILARRGEFSSATPASIMRLIAVCRSVCSVTSPVVM